MMISVRKLYKLSFFSFLVLSLLIILVSCQQETVLPTEGVSLSNQELWDTKKFDEIINSIKEIEGLGNLVEDIAKKISDLKDNEENRTFILPIWIISHLKNEKPTMEDINGPGIDIAKLLDSCIRDYEAKQLNKNL